MHDANAARIAIVLKGWPRISETFIAKELLGLEERGLSFLIVSLRRPTDRITHDLHERITAPCLYLPEYLHEAPLRVLRGLWRSSRLPGWWAAWAAFRRDLARDRTRNRVRRMGQAAVLAAELPAGIAHLHAHFIHTPGSVARYASLLRGLPLTLSAHAKDIWTTPDWEKREKLEAARWSVTCTAENAAHLRALAPRSDIELLYHGVDLARFRPLPRLSRTGLDIVSVARCVPKKGLDTLLDALALLPASVSGRHTHVGGGPLSEALRTRAANLGLDDRIVWRGSLAQLDLVPVLASADLLCLPSRVAADGDRDGLPNVLLEAMACGLPVVATSVAAIPELVQDGQNGLLVPADDPAALAAALTRLAMDEQLRRRMGEAARATVAGRFGEAANLDRLAARFGLSTATARAA